MYLYYFEYYNNPNSKIREMSKTLEEIYEMIKDYKYVDTNIEELKQEFSRYNDNCKIVELDLNKDEQEIAIILYRFKID